jgi:crossover junction endodeoxyribonuclease RusA
MTPPRTLQLTVPALPPSGNRWLRPRHWAERRADMSTWITLMRGLAKAARRAGAWDGQPFARAQVLVIYHFPDARRRDPDNYTTALKGVLDGLVAAGVLIDDDFAHCTLTVRAGRPRPPGHLVLYIIEDQEGETDADE